MVEQVLEIQTSSYGALRGILTLPDSLNINKLLISITGFEEPGTAEEKFKTFGKSLVQKGIASFRFDFSGLGISEGEFQNITVQEMAEQFYAFIVYLKEKFQIEELNVIAHSLGSCVLAKSLANAPVKISKAILIAPALNQKELLRFWFTRKHSPPHINIQWQNYRQFLDEKAFQADLQIAKKEAKTHWIANYYYLENAQIDYTDLILNSKLALLHIHGDADTTVPLPSVRLSVAPFIIEGGDHELEKPSLVEKWLPKALDFFI